MHFCILSVGVRVSSQFQNMFLSLFDFPASLFSSFIAPPVKTTVKERRPSSGGVKPVQQVFYTEWKNETGLFLIYEIEYVNLNLKSNNSVFGYFKRCFSAGLV